MNQDAASKGFVFTRARLADPETSKQAAKNAATLRTMLLRSLLSQTIRNKEGHWWTPEAGYVVGWTAKELADYLDEPLPDVYRRLPETGGIKRHDTMRRDGCSVYVKAD